MVWATRSLDGVTHTDIIITVWEVLCCVRDGRYRSRDMGNARSRKRHLVYRLALNGLVRCLIRMDNDTAHHLQRLRQISKEPLNLFPRDQLQASRTPLRQVHIKTVRFLSDRVYTRNDILLPVT